VGLKLVSSKFLDGNGVKAIPGSIPEPNSGSFENILTPCYENIPKNS